MNKLENILLLIFIFSLNLGCDRFRTDSPHIAFSDKIVDAYLEDMKTKYGLQCFGRGGGFINKVNEIHLAFVIQGAKDQDELQELIVAINEDLLHRFNKNEEIRPYLKNYPFTEVNLSISILLLDENGRSFLERKDMDVALQKVKQFNGDIVYQVNEPGKITTRDIHTETYEEALKIVKHKNETIGSDL